MKFPNGCNIYLRQRRLLRQMMAWHTAFVHYYKVFSFVHGQSRCQRCVTVEVEVATVVMMKHAQSGLVRKGFFGFSWTTLFFGGWPAIFRGDFIVGAVFIILQIFTVGVAGFIWAFLYNKNYTRKMLEKGYQFADSEGVVSLAKASIGVAG